jgi:hypothetical protein
MWHGRRLLYRSRVTVIPGACYRAMPATQDRPGRLGRCNLMFPRSCRSACKTIYIICENNGIAYPFLSFICDYGRQAQREVECHVVRLCFYQLNYVKDGVVVCCL